MARGINIRTLGLVINIDVPRFTVNGDIDYKTYLHRVGRTGGFSDKGVALTLINGFSEKREM